MGKIEATLENAKRRRESLVWFIGSREMTTMEISKASGIDPDTVYNDIRTLRAEKKMHISGYRGRAPLYAVGDKPDADRIKDEKKDEQKVKIQAFRHWMDVALFGEYRKPSFVEV